MRVPAWSLSRWAEVLDMINKINRMRTGGGARFSGWQISRPPTQQASLRAAG